jgi:hypothetical protein
MIMIEASLWLENGWWLLQVTMYSSSSVTYELTERGGGGESVSVDY